MANPNGKKGATFERQIANHLAENWPWHGDFIDRQRLTGAKDRGDIANVRVFDDKVAVECKNTVEHRASLGGWIREAEDERRNLGAIAGVVVHKRVRHGQPGDQYVTMTVDSLIALLRSARGGWPRA